MAQRTSVAAMFADLPLRWKILAPFAALALVYGVSGTYVFSRGTAAETRANLSGRLRDAATVAVNELDQRQFSLASLARQVARTEGVADALARGDRARLRRLALPPSLNAGHSLVVTDVHGVALLDVTVVKGADPLVRAGTDWRGVPLISQSARERDATLAELDASFVEHGGVAFLAVAAPTGFGRAGPVGVVLALSRVEDMLDELTSLTGAGHSVVAADGRVLAGADVPRPGSPGETVQVRGRRLDFLYTPLTIRGERRGVLVTALPSVSGLGTLGEQGWKIAFLAIAVLGGVFLAGMWVARRISRPLGSLVDSTRALERGELAHRAEVGSRDEVGALATSFNQMAEQLEASHGDLERRVDERTHELAETLERLDRTNAELAKASEAKSAFLASMSHELRTPLSGIIVAAEMLQDRRFGQASERKTQDLAAKIAGSGKHLLALIEDLLDLSRIEAGRIELQPVPMPLGDVLSEARGAIAPLAGRKGVSVQIPSADGHRVLADPLRLRQVLVNLLMNAVKFTGSGGRVWVEVTPAGPGVSVAVRDTGAGIERKDLKRIFEPFEQASRGKHGGAGLGLAISRRIAELHGGKLTVASTPGKGSTFTLTLPSARPAARPAAEAPRTGRATAAARPASILLVEDDPTLGDLMGRVLRSGGHDVARADSVDGALAAIRSHPVDLVLLDVRLGERDGLEVVRRLRADPSKRGLPVVALSANALRPDVERALSAGCNGYLVKPIGGRALLERVGEFLKDARANGPSRRARGSAPRKAAR